MFTEEFADDIIAVEKLTYREAMTELEQILTRMRSGEMAVDELTEAVRRAKELIAKCRGELLVVERDVEELISSDK